jgi:predicted lipoprotein with Yx(FWY)xxD motif
MTISSRTALLAASGIASLALVAACGSGGPGGSGAGSGSASSSPPAATAPAGQGGTAATLQAGTDPALGAIVTDSAGHTLYRFDKDTAQPSASNCNDACAKLWPPAAADGQASVKGIDGKLVGAVTRADGSKQLTLNGWPLYRYTPDTKPGDTRGQGVGGVWFVITPDGARAAAAPATSPGTGGYGY